VTDRWKWDELTSKESLLMRSCLITLAVAQCVGAWCHTDRAMPYLVKAGFKYRGYLVANYYEGGKHDEH